MQQAKQTLVHEVIHILLLQAGRTKQSQDEDMIDALAYGLLAALVDNPKLFEYLVND